MLEGLLKLRWALGERTFDLRVTLGDIDAAIDEITDIIERTCYDGECDFYLYVENSNMCAPREPDYPYYGPYEL